MARCLVVGGNGFLGSHVVDQLVERGHEVTVFDRFTSPQPLYTGAGVRRITGDFSRADDLRGALRGQEYVFHFLSTTTPATADNDPSRDVRTNVADSVGFFELAVEAGVSRIHFASTGGAMYGDVLDTSIAETAVPAPVSPYAIGKLAIEGYLRYFHRRHGLESVSYRISNPYGPRQHPDKKQGVIPIFLHRIAEGRSLEVFGDGSMVRDYIYVGDVARMITETVGRPARHAVYNVGSGVGVSLNEIVRLAGAVTGRTPEVEHRPQPTTFVDRVVLDTARFTAEFGVSPSVPLEEGIALTWRDISGSGA